MYPTAYANYTTTITQRNVIRVGTKNVGKRKKYSRIKEIV